MNQTQRNSILGLMIVLLLILFFFLGYHVGKEEILRHSNEFYRDFMDRFCICWEEI